MNNNTNNSVSSGSSSTSHKSNLGATTDNVKGSKKGGSGPTGKKFVALLSGGKDSIYNTLQCIAMGHELVAVANIYPKVKEDGDVKSGDG